MSKMNTEPKRINVKSEFDNANLSAKNVSYKSIIEQVTSCHRTLWLQIHLS